jgi:hypothetical protein
MRRSALIPLFALALILWPAPDAGAALYRTSGDGMRIVLRVQGNRVVWANVLVRLYCTRPNGERHLNRYKQNYASPENPIQLNGRGRFSSISRGRQEEGFVEEEALFGRVGAERVTGQYEYLRDFILPHRDVTCQTRSYPISPRLVAFRARRR